MNKKILFVGLVIIIVAYMYSASAEECSASISGKIDFGQQDNSAAINATIQIVGASGLLNYTETDENGLYTSNISFTPPSKNIAVKMIKKDAYSSERKNFTWIIGMNNMYSINCSDNISINYSIEKCLAAIPYKGSLRKENFANINETDEGEKVKIHLAVIPKDSKGVYIEYTDFTNTDENSSAYALSVDTYTFWPMNLYLWADPTKNYYYRVYDDEKSGVISFPNFTSSAICGSSTTDITKNFIRFSRKNVSKNCSYNDECKSNLCYNGTCKASNFCTNDSWCNTTAFCNSSNNLCLPKKDIGENCSANYECNTNICTITCQGYTTYTYYKDADNDSYGDNNSYLIQQIDLGNKTIINGTNYTKTYGDCNDSNSLIHPNAPDIPNDWIDQNCNSYDNRTYYQDFDNDIYGNLTNNQTTDYIPSGTWITNVSMATDCNDSNALINPNAAEIYNAIDDNCVNGIDECSPANYSVNDTLYCNENATMQLKEEINASCSASYECLNNTCNHYSNRCLPNITNFCYDNSDCVVSNFCNLSKQCQQKKEVNTNCSADYECFSGSCNMTCQGYTYYKDVDNDGYGDSYNATNKYIIPTDNGNTMNYSGFNYTKITGDCNDSNPTIHPNATEIYNGIDDNCVNGIDECSSANSSVNDTIYCNENATMQLKEGINAPCSASYDCSTSNCNNYSHRCLPNITNFCYSSNDCCNLSSFNNGSCSLIQFCNTSNFCQNAMFNSNVSNSNITNGATVSNSTINNSNLNNSTADNSYISNSTVNNSILYNSTADNSIITNSTVNNSILYNSTVSGSNITNGSTLNNSTGSNSTISNSTVSGSSITNGSTLNNSTASNSNLNNTIVLSSNIINNSTLYNSTVYNSIIDNSTLYNSTVYNSIIDNSALYNSTAGNSIITNSTINNSNLNNSTVSGSSITNNSALYNSTADNSIITNSTINNSILYNSTVSGSSIKNGSTLNNSTVSNSYINNSTISNSNIANNSITNNSTSDNSNVSSSAVNSSYIFNSTINNSALSNSTITNSDISNSNITNSTITFMNLQNVSITNNVMEAGILKTGNWTYKVNASGLYINGAYYSDGNLNLSKDCNTDADCYNGNGFCDPLHQCRTLEILLIYPAHNKILNFTPTINVFYEGAVNSTVLEFTFPNGTTQNLTANISKGVASFSLPSSLQNGTYKFKAYIFDVFGNNKSSELLNFIINTSAINIDYTNTTPKQNAFISKNFTVEFQSGAPIAQIWAVIKNEATNETTTIFLNYTSNQTEIYSAAINTENLFDGNYTITVYANDTNGNIGCAGERTITIDNTKPYALINIFVSEYSANLTLNFSEKSNLTFCYWKDTTFTNCSSYPFALFHTLNLSNLQQNETYQFNATFCDLAGNCNFTTGNFTTKPTDITPPSANISIPATNKTNTSTIININFSENTSLTLRYGTNSSDLNTTISYSTFNTTYSLNIQNLASNQTYFLNLTYCDNNGNCNSTFLNFSTLKGLDDVCSSSDECYNSKCLYGDATTKLCSPSEWECRSKSDCVTGNCNSNHKCYSTYSGSGSSSGSSGGSSGGSPGNSPITVYSGCGDKICSSNENCNSCPTDCGKCIICGDKICEGKET